MLWLALLWLLAGGCAVSHRRAVPPAQIRPALEASKEELIARYNRLAASVHSLNAGADLLPVAGSSYTGVIEEYHDVRGFILAQRPASIRIIGQAPVVAKNIFDMVSDGETFRIFIPSKNRFIIGPAALERPSKKPIENLRPQHVLDALFWPEIVPREPVLFEEFNAEPERYYILTALRGLPENPAIARKIWFDRTDLSLARIQIYGAGGRLVSDSRYSDWQPAAVATRAGNETQASLVYPRDIRIARPHDDYRLEVRITKLTLNEEISAERFHLAQPPGTELVHVGEDEGARP